jgi:predicted RNase H-like HicB family nuclease
MRTVTKAKAATPSEYLKKPYVRQLVPEADGSFRAEILEFPGCIAIGDTAAEAFANLESVAESWLISTIAKGQRVPDPIENVGYSGKLVLRLPKTLHRKATQVAAREGGSLNQFIVACIAEGVGNARALAHTNQFNVVTSTHLSFVQVGLLSGFGKTGAWSRALSTIGASGTEMVIGTGGLLTTGVPQAWEISNARG